MRIASAAAAVFTLGVATSCGAQETVDLGRIAPGHEFAGSYLPLRDEPVFEAVPASRAAQHLASRTSAAVTPEAGYAAASEGRGRVGRSHPPSGAAGVGSLLSLTLGTNFVEIDGRRWFTFRMVVRRGDGERELAGVWAGLPSGFGQSVDTVYLQLENGSGGLLDGGAAFTAGVPKAGAADTLVLYPAGPGPIAGPVVLIRT